MPSLSRAACVLLITGCTGVVDDPEVTGDATLAVTALSPDEVVAEISLPVDGTLACGAASRTVVAGTWTVYLAVLEPGADMTCTASCSAPDGDKQATADVVMPAVRSAGKVVFDNSHGEQAGNADWVIDDDDPSPSPSSPSGPDSWTGAYSSFGYGLWLDGYTLSTNTRWISPDTLADAQVLVLPEPNTALDADEMDAIVAFVARGGGVVLITDHHLSDRDFDGVDSTNVADSLFAALGVGTRQASDASDVGTEYNYTASAGDPADPVLHGRNGDVTQVDFYDASAFTLSGLPGDRPVLWLGPNAGDDSKGARVVATYAGAGRVLSIGDSAPADDGTGDPYDDLFASWNEADDAALYLNAVDWAAGVR